MQSFAEVDPRAGLKVPARQGFWAEAKWVST
jgi:hypothetical protein